MVKRFLLFSLMFSLISCAPEHRPIRKDDGKKRSKIQMSGFNGSGYDVLAFNLLRLNEVKRIVEISMLPPVLLDEQKNELQIQNAKCPYSGNRELNKVYDRPENMKMKIYQQDCNQNPKGGLGATLTGLEILEAEYESSTDEAINYENRRLTKMTYNANNLTAVFSKRASHQPLLGLTGSSRAKTVENRTLTVDFRNKVIDRDFNAPRYSFEFEVETHVDQTMYTKTLAAEERDGVQKLTLTGDFYVEPTKKRYKSKSGKFVTIYGQRVMAMTNISLTFDSESPRQIFVRRGTRTMDKLFLNEKNSMSLSAHSYTPIYIEKECDNIQGSFIAQFENTNEDRNRFFGMEKKLAEGEIVDFVNQKMESNKCVEQSMREKGKVSPSCELFSMKKPYCFKDTAKDKVGIHTLYYGLMFMR